MLQIQHFLKIQAKFYTYYQPWLLCIGWCGLITFGLINFAFRRYQKKIFLVWFGFAGKPNHIQSLHFCKSPLSPCPAGTPAPLYLLHKSDCLAPSQHTHHPDFFDLSTRVFGYFQYVTIFWTCCWREIVWPKIDTPSNNVPWLLIDILWLFAPYIEFKAVKNLDVHKFLLWL